MSHTHARIHELNANTNNAIAQDNHEPGRALSATTNGKSSLVFDSCRAYLWLLRTLEEVQREDSRWTGLTVALCVCPC
jgi:hypothetical protein